MLGVKHKIMMLGVKNKISKLTNLVIKNKEKKSILF
jgi:hypothetical protein